MARYKNGINGPLSGKVGSVIAASWRGIDYFRSVGEPAGKPASPAQLAQRRILSIVSSWLKPLKALIWIGFQEAKEGRTPMNELVSFMMKEGLVGQGPEMRIDFTKAVFSKGELLVSFVRELIVLAGALLHIKWEDLSSSIFCREDDMATFIVYNPEKEKFVTFERIAARADQEAVLQLPTEFVRDNIHCYMQYVNAAGNRVSTSVYLAKLVLE